MVKILKVKDLNYRDWKDVNLHFESGKFYYVAGENNSGKTTLFKLLAGLIDTSNVITCDSVILNNSSRKDYIQKIGVVKQIDKHAFLYKKVLDELTYPLYNLNYKKNAILRRIDETLSFFEMDYIMKKNIDELSQFEKQILLLLISLLHHPKVLLLDGVLELIPEVKRSIIVNKLLLLVKNGLCIINFTNNLVDSLNADRIIIINNFSIVKEVSVEEMFNNDKLFYENGLEIPFICDINVKLKMYQLLDKNYMDMKELVDKIWQ